jgi:predicted HTH transcriptional regulator
MISPKQFRALLGSPEGSRVEFKAAMGKFQFEELAKYCVAIANEGGGHIVLGVTNMRPRKTVGTHAFSEPGRTEASLFDKLHQLLRELVKQNSVHVHGSTRAARWYPGKKKPDCSH